MAPRVDPVTSSETVPHKTSVVVIGGGIVGVSTALFLAEKGIPVVLCEKGRIGAEQSSRNWGWTRVMGRDPKEIPLGMESLKLWRRMNDITGAETGFRQAGIVYLCETRAEVEKYEEWLEHARPFQLDSRLLAPGEIDRVLPGSAVPWAGALHTPSDGRAEPTKAAPAIAEAARRLGATILTGCAVRGVETKAGHISGVVTETGRIDCDSVVLAGGAWSRLFCGNMNLHLPQLKVLGSVLRTQPLDGAPETTAGGGNFAFRKRLDGGYTVARRNASTSDITPDSFRLFFDFLPNLRTSWRELRLRIGSRFLEEWRIPRSWSLDQTTPFEQVRVLDPMPVEKTLAEARENLGRAFPAFRQMQIAESWGGLIDVTPDAVPVISPVATLPGFFLATGFSGHGFGIGPGAGKLAADLVAGDTPAVDPHPYRYARFVDGSWKKAS
ncbi:NAD(P)/FAD-dependent oxidoreductase [Limobrevibacterium gyesilva]|uniref:FAD-binding oxidoreductase n=1 Tax=Limobrevibacterium gyesilva TaxID=2991712 RepID=A0AA42CEK1_9PROT|nr:FAD-binding oxidoreductase [Limobrevibacterium gyesilva]MCW3475384.1 FAD-binding oxidoreductase [Limobrevibacterium gyesilva]